MRSIARVLVGVLLFTQAALAIAACEWLGRAPAQAIAQSATPQCLESETRADNRANNLCVAHCLAEFQSLDTHQVPVFAFPAAPVLAALAPVPPSLAALLKRQFVTVVAAAPPPRILFQHFLI